MMQPRTIALCCVEDVSDVSIRQAGAWVLLDVPLPPASAQGCEVSEYCSKSIADPGNLPRVWFNLDKHCVVYFF